MKLAFASVATCALLLAGAARAQLAVAPTHAQDDPLQRHLVSAVVKAALDRWQALSPQLLPDDLRRCAANDMECLRELARKRGASHLLVIGVAPLGPRDAVVSAQLFAVGQRDPLFEGTAVQAGDAGGTDDGLDKVRELAGQLTAIPGPPPAVARPAPPPVEAPSSDLGVLGLGGIGAISLGAVGAGVTALLAAQGFTGDQDYRAVQSTVVVGGALSGALLLGGVVMLTVEAL